VLFAQPPRGFGRVFTDYRVTKVPVAFSFQVNPKLAVGASVNVYIGQFAVSPLPYKVFDLDALGQRYYRRGRAGQPVDRDAPGRVLLPAHADDEHRRVGDVPQNFSPYEWNALGANGAANYGIGRVVDFDLDGPLIHQLRDGAQARRDAARDRRDVHEVTQGVEVRQPGGIIDGIVYPSAGATSGRSRQAFSIADRYARRARRLQLQPDALRKEVV
jgi:hypothetical protein